MYSCMGSVSVSSCRYCMFVSCVYPVAVLNAAFCVTCSLLMMVKDARGNHKEETYSRTGLITDWLHKAHPTHGGAVTVVWQTLCKLCLPLPPQQWGPNNHSDKVNIIVLG